MNIHVLLGVAFMTLSLLAFRLARPPVQYAIEYSAANPSGDASPQWSREPLLSFENRPESNFGRSPGGPAPQPEMTVWGMWAQTAQSRDVGWGQRPAGA